MKIPFPSFIFVIVIAFSLFVSMVPSDPAHAIKLLNTDNLQNDAERFGNAAGYAIAERDPVTLVATIIRAFLGLLGVIFLVLLVYAGYLWMTAQGEEEQVTKAKSLITQAVIGLIIVLSAYAVSYFIVDRLERATLQQSTPAASS